MVISPSILRTRVDLFRSSFLLITLCVAAIGCASPGAGSPEEPSSGDRNLITATDLEGLEELNAYEAIRRLRPRWVRYRGQSTFSGSGRESLRVYVDNSLFGNAESLSNLMIRHIETMRFLDGRQATLRFGTDHTVGAILITTSRGQM